MSKGVRTILNDAREKNEDDGNLRLPSTSIDQFVRLEDNWMDGQVRILVFFHGHIDSKRLSLAVKLTLNIEPVLGYRYVDKPHHPYWLKVDERNWIDPFSMLECSPSDPLVHDFMVDPVDPDDAPQIRVRLFRGQNDLMCIRSNHLALDGGGAVQYLYLLASMYCWLEVDHDPRPDMRSPQRLGPRHIIREVGILHTLRSLSAVRVPGAGWGIPRENDDMSGKTFLVRRLGADVLGEIRSYARGRGVTVNDILLTAFCRSLFTLCEPHQGKGLLVEIPVDLRRHLRGEPITICDLSAAYLIAIDRRVGEHFDDTLRRVHRMMDRRKRKRTELVEMLLLEMMLLPGPALLRRIVRSTGSHSAHPTLSNLGAIDDSKVDFGTAIVEDVQFIGPVLYPPNIGLSISTYRGRLSISLNYVPSASDPELVERLLDLFIRELPADSSLILALRISREKGMTSRVDMASPNSAPPYA